MPLINLIERTIAALVLSATVPAVFAVGLESEFQSPPDAARPGVYWYFIDGNQNRDAMVADLHAMRDVGIGTVTFLEVDLGIPRGPVPFMSAQWQDNVAHAFVEAGKLGMEVVLGTGPGWSGSGGSWVGVGDSMQHLVGSSVQVSGPGTLNQVLPVPPPHAPNPYSGMNATHAAQRDAWFQDVAVIAYPTPPGGAVGIDEVDIKTLKDVLPYSIRQTQQLFVRPQAAYDEPDASRVIDPSRAVDLTSLLQPDGSITWTIPEGNWTVMRFVERSTGQTTRPAPQTGHGFEHNKFDAASYRRHWDNYQKVLLEKIVAKGGPLQPGKGLTTIHLDSWEMSSQNWTRTFRQEFQTRRGYDPQPFYPAWMGQVTASREQTERFLWDMRKTSQELVLENYAGAIKQVAHQHGLLYSNQPYDMNPAGNIDLGSVADIPGCEFWNDSVDTQYGVIEAVSIARTMGRQLVRAEAFTSGPSEAFTKYPANMKNQTDWAFALGITGFIFHTYLHQPLGAEARPGMTLGPHGIHWGRNQHFWDLLPDYHRYLARCSHLLRQGAAVSDILYLTPEGAPHIFEAPADAFEGAAGMRDKKGHAFDAVTPRILAMRAGVQDGCIAFPGGSGKYRLLVLPDVPTMTPETLAKIDELIQAGATVIGKPPVRSPSLVDYPACDTAVSTLAGTMWGGTAAPVAVTRIDRGSGAIYWGGDLQPAGGALYPGYTATAAVLTGLGLAEDFTSPSGKLRFLHRRTADRDVYFVSNRSEERVVTEGVFRIDGLRPQLWDPMTGETRALENYTHAGGLTRVPLVFEPLQSWFVVFPQDSAGGTPPASPAANFPTANKVTQLGGAWQVAFDPAMGGPEAIAFEQLVDWTQRPEEGIRYYSGKATYRKTFDLPGFDPAADNAFLLDLGTVHGVCQVRLNGQDLGTVWTAPWRVNLSPALQANGNQLEITLANTWVNRLIGDQQPAHTGVRTLSWPSGLLGGTNHAAGRHSFVTHPFYNAASPLKPAGLVGPVSILSLGPDTYPPGITRLLPANNSANQIIPATLKLIFDEPVIAGTGSVTVRNLTDGSQTTIDITDTSRVVASGSVLTITPTDGLQANKHHAIRIVPGAVTDLAGNPHAGIADDAGWNFTTSASAAKVIIEDGFSGAFVAGNGAMAGRTPDTVNQPGNTYTEQQNANVQARMELDTATGNPASSLKTGFNNSAHLRYSEDIPTQPVTLSIDVQLHTIQDDGDPRGIGLGFWSPLPILFPGTETYSTTRFTGILVNPSGTLEYVRGGVSQGVFTATPAGFSTAAFLNLTYTVDPVARSVTRLVFAGNDHTADFLTRFPADFTPGTSAGFLASTANNAGFFGRVDNFIVAMPQAAGPPGARIYLQAFEEIHVGEPDVILAGAAGIFTGSTWPTAPEFVLSGPTNLLKPAAGSPWLSSLPTELGTTFAVLHSGVTATTNLEATFADHTTYTLSFTHFRRDDLAGDAVTARILSADGAELVGETFPAVTSTGTFEARTLNWTTAGGPEVGQPIRLQLLDPNAGTAWQQTGIDNISLVATSVPTFSNWISSFDLGSLTGLTDDPDGDGLPNAVEAWFGTHPGEANAGISNLAADDLTVTFTHPMNENPPDDLSGFYEWSPNLDDWYAGDGVAGPVGGKTVAFSSVTAGGITTVTATTSKALESLFFRLVVVLQR